MKQVATKAQKQGFTLIELLVVISIISLLASILFPVFARARENARRASCISNEKQIALGFLMYAQDYDGRLPVYDDTTPQFWWSDIVYPYVKNRQIYRCPSAPEAGGSAATPGSLYEPTYAFNGATGAGLYTDTGRLLVSIEKPSITWMLVETRYPDESTWQKYGYGFAYAAFYSTTLDRPADWSRYNDDVHLDGSNVAYADGHVKWHKKNMSLTGQNWRGE